MSDEKKEGYPKRIKDETFFVKFVLQIKLMMKLCLRSLNELENTCFSLH